MPNTISGTVDRTYFTSPKFSAGVLVSDTGDRVRFRGPFCANEGDMVTMIGQWKVDRKYGPQFAADSLSYELPTSTEGLILYLAKHPAFVGIGEATARKIVAHAASAAHLDRLIRQDIDELHRELRIRKSTLESLREAWIAHSADNEVRSYLASFGLTHHQMETLLQTFGNSVVGVLRADPYQLIRYVKGYGFKKVDKIARAMGAPKDHVGRIEAGVLYVVSDELSSGHTWTSGADVLNKANDLLLLDTLDSRDVIRQAGERLLQDGQIVADGSAVSTPRCLETEQFIQSVFDLQGWDERPLAGIRLQLTGLKDKQAEAYRIALRYCISVISGGAGTGKTYVLARLSKSFQDAGLRVALCSPTGKAAKRIEESLRAQSLDLEAKTIHRLLEYDGRDFHRENLSRPSGGDDDDASDVDSGFDVVVVTKCRWWMYR